MLQQKTISKRMETNKQTKKTSHVNTENFVKRCEISESIIGITLISTQSSQKLQYKKRI